MAEAGLKTSTLGRGGLCSNTVLPLQTNTVEAHTPYNPKVKGSDPAPTANARRQEREQYLD